MEGVLRTLNLEGNISRYVQCFQIAGYNSFDDLLITEPSLDDLAVIGISNLGDREKIYYEINPEAALMDAGLLNSRGTGTLSPRANKFDDYDFDETPSYGGYDAGGAAALSPEEEEYMALKKQYDMLLNGGGGASDNSGMSEAELEMERMKQEHAELLRQLNGLGGAGGGRAAPTYEKTAEELEYERTKAEYQALMMQANSILAEPQMTEEESEYERTKRELESIRAQLSGAQAAPAEEMSEAEAELANAKAEYQAMLEQMNSVSSSGPNADDEAEAIMAEMNRIKELMALKAANPDMEIGMEDVDGSDPVLNAPQTVTYPRTLAVAAGATAPQNDGMRKVQSNMELNSRALPARPQNKAAEVQVRRRVTNVNGIPMPTGVPAPSTPPAPAPATPVLNNSQIAAKAREMMTAGIDRATIAAWVKEQQALQNAPPVAQPAPAATPTPQARALPTPQSRALPQPGQPGRDVSTPQPQVRPAGPTIVVRPGQSISNGATNPVRPQGAAGAASNPTGAGQVRLGAGTGTAANPAPNRVALPTMKEDTVSNVKTASPTPTNVVYSDNVPQRPDDQLRAPTKGAELLASKTGMTLTPVKGSGISGVTLIQDSSAKAQIEALKALASEGKNMSFGNDLLIEVADPVTVGKSTAQVTLFLVRLTTNMRQFSHLTFNKLEVRRRFNHFEELYNKLMAATNSCLALPKFPKKDFFARTKENIVEQRLTYFQSMMTTIAKDPGLRCLSCVVDFFDDSKMTDIKFNDDGSAKLKGTSVTGRVKEGLKETGKDLKSLLKKNKDEY